MMSRPEPTIQEFQAQAPQRARQSCETSMPGGENGGRKLRPVHVVLLERLHRLSRRFRHDDAGLALVEFAMVLPLMVLLYVGGIAVTQAIMTDRKVILLTRSLGDIVARDTAITSSESTDVFNAASAVMVPYNASATILRMRVSSVRINNKSKSCIVWSLSPNSGFARKPKDNVDAVVPADLRASTSSYLILSEVEYDYTPIIGVNLIGTIKMHETLYLKPRQSTEVTSY